VLEPESLVLEPETLVPERPEPVVRAGAQRLGAVAAGALAPGPLQLERGLGHAGRAGVVTCLVRGAPFDEQRNHAPPRESGLAAEPVPGQEVEQAQAQARPREADLLRARVRVQELGVKGALGPAIARALPEPEPVEEQAQEQEQEQEQEPRAVEELEPGAELHPPWNLHPELPDS